jgi:hypothetical protein
MPVEGQPPPRQIYGRYADFLDGDRRRGGDALELGHDWRDGEERYRVCWYAETGELTCERLAGEEESNLEDFHRGIAGPIEILAHIPTRERLDELLGSWPNIAPNQPRTLRWLRGVVRELSALDPGANVGRRA